MIVCPRCAKENQDHYKFCLGCGAELPRDAAQPKSFTAPTPPAGVQTGAAPHMAPPVSSPQFGGAAASAAPVQAPRPAPVAQPAAPAPAPAAAAGGKLTCPQCGNGVPPNFKFCGSCGYDMTAKPAAPAAAAAPQPPPAAAPAMAMAPTPASGTPRGSLVLIRPDGSEGEVYPLADHTVVGRDAAGPFSSDSYLSPRHAEFRFQSGSMVVRDLGSLNGVYIRIGRDQPLELKPGSVFRIGQEILVYEALPAAQRHQDGTESLGSPNQGYVGRIRLVIGRDTFGNSYCVPAAGIHLGRERGDVIFPEDGYVSGLHCRIHSEGGKIYLTDVGSSNGTFFRIEGERPIQSGALLLMGQQLFRAEF